MLLFHQIDLMGGGGVGGGEAFFLFSPLGLVCGYEKRQQMKHSVVQE